MKKILRIAAIAILVVITITSLTSGISKERAGGFKDLVDELYAQSLKQNSSLEAIEDGIDNFQKKKQDALEKYNSFVNYNNRYYADARAKAATITEAATRQKANDLISNSDIKYRAKLADWQAAITTLNTSEKELNDLHSLLKIIVTEPLIEKYQNSLLPDNGKLKEANTDVQKLIEKIKAITK